MSDLNPPQEQALTAERYGELLSAVELLYIKGNMSARIKFFQDWPAPGRYILGEELIGFDTDGTDDFERKAALEEEAEERRYEFYDELKTLSEKSIQNGVLNLEYVSGLMQRWGREISELVFTPRHVERVFGSAPRSETSQPAPAKMPQRDMGVVTKEIEAQYAPNPLEKPKNDEPLPTPRDMVFSKKIAGPGIDNDADIKPIDTAPPSPNADEDGKES
ncbi:MAG: hypothetical protein KDJ35_08260 [Alphaproteobacteria bacterium]|nr:hypothetical protein [Alphaproteobacteria bacterium]